MYEQKITFTEALGKFYQFQDNSHTICKLSFWGRSAYEILKYSKTNDYVLIEGYLSIEKKQSNLLNKTPKKIIITVLKVYPFLLK
mgnify:CR=1 FL=1